ncbi:MAG: PAS domain S-box protein [Methanomicrobiales archaeon]|nr:PAS domain S-box protein [Methanomicrobiales archaeon]
MPDTVRVLYVDDEPSLLEIGKLFLEQSEDCSIVTIDSAPAALDLLQREHFDAIVSDYQMPGTDGIQFLIEVRAKFGQIPFILFTGKGREEVVIQAINNGVDFYIQKGGGPKAQFSELAHKIRHAVRQRRAEEALEVTVKGLTDAASRYETLIAASNTGAWEYHADSGFLWCSPEYFSMMGREINDFDLSGTRNIEQTWVDLLHPEDRERASRHFDSYLGSPDGMYEQHFRVLHKDGHWVWIWSRGKTLRNADGKPTRITVGTHIDISDRKRTEEELLRKNEELRASYEQIAAAEEELRGNLDEMIRAERELKESQTQLRATLEATADGILAVDNNGTILQASLRFAEIWRIPPPLMERGDDRALLDFVLGQLADPDAFLQKVQSLYDSDAVDMDTLAFNDGRVIERYSYPMTLDGARIGRVWSFRDISDRKRAEEALQESRRQLNAMASNIPGVVYRFYVNPDGTSGFDYISDRSLTILGLENDATTFFDRFTECIVPEDRERFFSSVQHAISTKTFWEFDGRYVKPSGKKIWISTVSSPVMENERLIFDGVTFDNTGRKQAEAELLRKNEELNASYEQIAAAEEELRANLESLTGQEIALRESGERYHQFFKTTLDSVFITTPDGKWVDFNDSLVEIFGYDSREEVFGVPVSSFYAHPEERSAFLELVQREGYVKEHPLQYKKKDGTVIDGLITIVPQKNPDGSLKGFIGTFHDITRKKRVYGPLSDREAFNQSRAENLPDYIAVYGTDGKVLYVNPAAVKALGYDAETMISTPILSYVAEEFRESVAAKIVERHEMGELPIYEIDLLGTDGLRRSVIVKGSQVMFHNKPATSLLLIDITERKALEEELTARAAKLSQISTAFQQANKKLNLLTTITRHDINNQLTILTGYLGILETEQPDPMLTEYCRKATSAADRISAMIRFTKEYEEIEISVPVWGT